jgi:integrase
MARPRKAQAALPPYVHIVRAKGRDYYYFERKASATHGAVRARLTGEPYDAAGLPAEEWWGSYRRAAETKAQGPVAGSFSALAEAYKASPEWMNLSDRTREERERHLRGIEAMWGRLPVRSLEVRHIFELRDSFADRPAAGNNMLSSLSALVSWSVPRGWRSFNPCQNIKKLRIGEGYEPWSWEDIEHFRRHAPVYMWRVAALALYSGQRQADVLKMLWTDIAAGRIDVIQRKTGKHLWVPIHADLQRCLRRRRARRRRL